MNKIGILTSGGDSPGMNAAIRAVVRTAICSGMSVVGIEHGYQGTLDKSFREMGMRSVSDIVQRGGTILRTARCVDFVKSEVQDQAIANMREAGIEGLVVIGGDGSFRGAQRCRSKVFRPWAFPAPSTTTSPIPISRSASTPRATPVSKPSTASETRRPHTTVSRLSKLWAGTAATSRCIRV